MFLLSGALAFHGMSLAWIALVGLVMAVLITFAAPRKFESATYTLPVAFACEVPGVAVATLVGWGLGAWLLRIAHH
jgi:hypothetical protein